MDANWGGRPYFQWLHHGFTVHGLLYFAFVHHKMLANLLITGEGSFRAAISSLLPRLCGSCPQSSPFSVRARNRVCSGGVRQYDASLILLFSIRHVCAFCRSLSHTYESGSGPQSCTELIGLQNRGFTAKACPAKWRSMRYCNLLVPGYESGPALPRGIDRKWASGWGTIPQPLGYMPRALTD